MIKVRAIMGGKDTLILGLNSINWERLVDNQPIFFDAGELGYPGMRVLILGGHTDDDLVEDLRAIGLTRPSTS